MNRSSSALHLLSLLFRVTWSSPSLSPPVDSCCRLIVNTPESRHTFTDLFQTFVLPNFLFLLLGGVLETQTAFIISPQNATRFCKINETPCYPWERLASVPRQKKAWRASRRHLEIRISPELEKPTHSDCTSPENVSKSAVILLLYKGKVSQADTACHPFSKETHTDHREKQNDHRDLQNYKETQNNYDSN